MTDQRLLNAVEAARKRFNSTCSCFRAECRADCGMTELEIDLAEELWEASKSLNDEFGGNYFPLVLTTFCEEVEQLD